MSKNNHHYSLPVTAAVLAAMAAPSHFIAENIFSSPGITGTRTYVPKISPANKPVVRGVAAPMDEEVMFDPNNAFDPMDPPEVFYSEDENSDDEDDADAVVAIEPRQTRITDFFKPLNKKENALTQKKIHLTEPQPQKMDPLPKASQHLTASKGIA